MPPAASLADELRPEGIIVARVDVSANNGVAQRFAVRACPPLLLAASAHCYATHSEPSPVFSSPRPQAAGLLKQLPTFILLRDRRVFTHTGGRSAETLAHFARKARRRCRMRSAPPPSLDSEQGRGALPCAPPRRSWKCCLCVPETGARGTPRASSPPFCFSRPHRV